MDRDLIIVLTLAFLVNCHSKLSAKSQQMIREPSLVWCLDAPALVVDHALKTTTILAQFDSTLSDLAVEAGDYVEKGQKIASLIRSHALRRDLIFSPVGGQVNFTKLSIGSYFNVGDEILRVTKPDQLWARISLPLGKRVTNIELKNITVTTMKSPCHTLRPSSLSQVVNTKNQTFDLLVQLLDISQDYQLGERIQTRVCSYLNLTENMAPIFRRDALNKACL